MDFTWTSAQETKCIHDGGSASECWSGWSYLAILGGLSSVACLCGCAAFIACKGAEHARNRGHNRTAGTLERLGITCAAPAVAAGYCISALGS